MNAVDVVAAEAALPAASQARLRQIVPFSLEESLADDVEHMVFAIGARLPSGTTQVAAVAKERMDSWLGRLRAAGIVPHVLCSEADGVPDIPATLVLVIEGERISCRKPGHAPSVFDGLTLEQVLSARNDALRRRGRVAPCARIHRCGGPGAIRRRARASRQPVRERRRQDVERRFSVPCGNARTTVGNESAARRVCAEIQLARDGETLAARGESRGRGRGARSRAARRRVLAVVARGRRARRRRGERVPACRRRLEHLGLPTRDPPASRRKCRRRDGGFPEHARGDRRRHATARCASTR